jgi:hypothetical protein
LYLRDGEVRILALLFQGEELPRSTDADCILSLLEDGLIEIAPLTKRPPKDTIQRLRLTELGYVVANNYG